MAKRVILAVAGAGKTYHICHEIKPDKKNLILAYTHENIHNIKRELISAHGYLPELTNIMTFDSFVYRYLILPFEPSIMSHFNCPSMVSMGITTLDPPPRQIKTRSGRQVANPRYVAKDKIGHYMTRQKQYYCSTLSELALQIKKGRSSLIKRAAESINMFYDQLMIDEFQDFREYDYDLITTLSKYVNNILLVGDYYQHSVSANNNSGKPFKKGSKIVEYDEFIVELQNAGFIIDTQTLSKSRRCSSDVCSYVQKKLGINIEAHGANLGSVIWADHGAKQIIEDPSILKLVYNEAFKYTFRAMNWSYSKGDTVDCACVILTDKFETLDSDNFSQKKVAPSTINKLYVAMTRSRGNLYLMKASIFKKIQKSYLKPST